MIRIGLIGCGSIGEAHAAILAGMPDVVLHAFCDRDLTRARTSAEHSGSGFACADPADVIHDKSVDAVCICTRTDSHATLGIAGRTEQV
jgi:predicted dehydrogenase